MITQRSGRIECGGVVFELRSVGKEQGILERGNNSIIGLRIEYVEVMIIVYSSSLLDDLAAHR